MENNISKKRAVLFLTFLYGYLLAGWLLGIFLTNPYNQTVYTLLWGLFSVFPVLATILARVLTKDSAPWLLKPNFRKSWKQYLFAAYVPGTAIFLSGVLYFLLFPQDLDLTARNLVAQYGQYGAPETLNFTPLSIFWVGFAFIFLSPLIFPVHLFALGEEVGWRGYLLPNLLKFLPRRKAILTSGLLWGLGHAPLIYFGFNYGEGYWGAPWSGVLMMTLLCGIWGIWLATITIRSESILPATIAHGAANVIGELPALVSFLRVSPLLGPTPTGIIGMSGLLLGAVILLRKLPGK